MVTNLRDGGSVRMMLINAAMFPSETWADEFFLRHLELTEDAEYFEEEISWQLRRQKRQRSV